MKLYEKYKQLKQQDSNKLYLFKNGGFYIFLGEDADKINEYVVLKRTTFNKEIMKCGFPLNSKDEYLKVFKNHKLNIELIETIDDNPLKILENIVNDNIRMYKKWNIKMYKSVHKITI